MAVRVFQNNQLLVNLKYTKPSIKCVIKRESCVNPNTNVILLEGDPNVISNQPQAVLFTIDMIGPPHPVSNLRPIIWYRSPTETPLLQRLRNLQEETQAWNQRFWETHNSNFIKERKNYVAKHTPADATEQTLTADQMSGFYKEFLDKNWQTHTTYNLQWYKRNFTILFLSIAASLEKLLLRS